MHCVQELIWYPFIEFRTQKLARIQLELNKKFAKPILNLIKIQAG